MYNSNADVQDAGLRKFMTSVYNLMVLGLLASFATAWFVEASGFLVTLTANPILFLIVALSPLFLVIAMSFGVDTMKLSTLHMLYWAFVIIEGVGLSVIMSKYTGGSILLAFVSAAAGFAGCSLYGYTTRRNLGPIGAFLIFALFGLIGMMILNIFIPSPMFSILISLAGILIFAGLTAWDTQSLKVSYLHNRDHDALGRIVVMGALNLYLDFLNIFLFILRLVGVKKD